MCSIINTSQDNIKEKLDSCISKALYDLYKYDSYLVSSANGHVAERSIMFRLGVYLDKYLCEDDILKSYDFDAEYNKNEGDLKRMNNYPNGVQPDLIIHKRGSNEYNLLVIECKGHWSTRNSISDDNNKLRGYLKSPYYYRFALQLIFGKKQPELIWIDKEKSSQKN